MNLQDNINKGKQSEAIAKEYLIKSGYKILDLNWHYSKNAEIDIIAEEKDTIVFVEVKTRTSLNYGHPFEAISKEKIDKINQAILAYLKLIDKQYKQYRIDGIAVIGLKNPKIEHLQNIGQY